MPRPLPSILATFSAVVLLSVLAGTPAASQAPLDCSAWRHSGDFDARFKVWACADGDPAAADADIATLAGLVEEMWDPMTQDPPEGMGPPKADAYGPSFPAETGGDARIDFYALRAGERVARAGGSSIPDTALAAARPAPPFTTASGTPLRTSSGFVMVARDRLGDGWKMRQDLVHEFFHVLQNAHNTKATYQGPRPHWFVEATATWAETYYLRSDSEVPHAWFETFQASPLGLEDPDEDHQYAAYIWPFFMEQEQGEQVIFRAWQAIEPLGPGDFKGVTDAIEREIRFQPRFREFAVRNLNVNDVLENLDPREPLYYELDIGFHDDVPPGHTRPGRVSPDERYVGSETMPPLSARYHDLAIAEEAREVTIDITTLSPASAVDGDALVHLTEGWWERRPVPGGVLKFCRDEDEPFNDIDRVIVVVSNHDRHDRVSGNLTVDAEASCDAGDVLILDGTAHGRTSQAREAGGKPDTAYAAEGAIRFRLVWTREGHRVVTFGSSSMDATYSGRCEADSTTTEDAWVHDSQPWKPPDPALHPGYGDDGSPWVIPHEQYSPWETDPTMVILGVGMWGDEAVGVCHWDGGYDDEFRAGTDIPSCFAEVRKNGGSWTGSCEETDEQTGQVTSWHIEAGQVRPDPSSGPP